MRGERSLLYRSASGTDASLTPRPGIDDTSLEGGGLSFWDSLDNPNLQSGKYVAIDPSKLRMLVVVNDNVPPGHVTVRPSTLEALRGWASSRGTRARHPFTQELIDADLRTGRK